MFLRYQYVSEDYRHGAWSVTFDHCEQGTNSMEELWSSVRRLLCRQKRDADSLASTKQVESPGRVDFWVRRLQGQWAHTCKGPDDERNQGFWYTHQISSNRVVGARKRRTEK